jgi:hypothetical protein
MSISATKSFSATPEAIGARRAKAADRYFEMEEEVSNLAGMANVIVILHDLYEHEKKDFSALDDVTGSRLVDHMERWSEAVSFMVHQMDRAASNLQQHYEG